MLDCRGASRPSGDVRVFDDFAFDVFFGGGFMKPVRSSGAPAENAGTCYSSGGAGSRHGSPETLIASQWHADPPTKSHRVVDSKIRTISLREMNESFRQVAANHVSAPCVEISQGRLNYRHSVGARMPWHA